jgi:spore coat protein A
MSQFKQQLHRQLPPTTVWGYNGTYPGPTIEARKGTPISVTYVNNLPPTHLFANSIDSTLHGVYGTQEVRAVVHLHGEEIQADSDGNPLAWFARGSQTHSYLNSQDAATLWYHDHALGITRLNVAAGLAGFYLLRDPTLTFEANLPAGTNDAPELDETGEIVAGPYKVPLVIQDRMFNADGSLFYPTEGVTAVHPKWTPEFFGDTILVNGGVWPYLEVEPRKYRFRFLNGSNSRFYRLSFGDKRVKAYQIGTDGGYLSAPAPITEILIAPAERADTVIDFSRCKVSDEILLTNSAEAPFPDGDAPDPATTGQIMKFNVVELQAPITVC